MISRSCNRVARFSSVAELSDDFRSHNFQKDESYDDWYGGSVDSVYDLLKNGDLEGVAEAEKVVSKINDSLDVAGVRHEWAPDMVGAFPSVPAYLAGDPLSMWARSPVFDDRGELSVYVNTTVSASCTPSEMRRRGVVILAVLLALQRVRNVRAVVYTSMDDCASAVDLSYPFDVSEVCAVITRPQITRRALYGASKKRGSKGWWAKWAAVVAGDDSERAAVRRLMGADENSLILTPHKLGSLARVSDSAFIDRLNGMLAAIAAGGAPEI